MTTKSADKIVRRLPPALFEALGCVIAGRLSEVEPQVLKRLVRRGLIYENTCTIQEDARPGTLSNVDYHCEDSVVFAWEQGYLERYPNNDLWILGESSKERESLASNDRISSTPTCPEPPNTETHLSRLARDIVATLIFAPIAGVFGILAVIGIWIAVQWPSALIFVVACLIFVLVQPHSQMLSVGVLLIGGVAFWIALGLRSERLYRQMMAIDCREKDSRRI